MRLKQRLTLRTVLVATAVLSLMTLLATQVSFFRAVNAEAGHLGARLNDVAMGVEAAYAGYAIEGRSMDDAELAGVAAQYGASLVRTEALPEAGVFRTGQRLNARCALTLNGRVYEIALEGSLAEVFYQNRLLLRRCTLASAAGLLVFWAFMRGVAEGMLKPLQALTEASADWTAGDMAARAEISGEDEIAALGRQLNDMAAALEDAIQRRDRLISDLTHEMKTPLAAVMGNADLIRRESAEAETLSRAQAIYREASRLDVLSRRMMQWILLKTDAAELKPINVRLLFEGAAAAFSARKIAIDVQATDLWVKADRVLMETLFINLVENSGYAGAKHIALSAEAAGGRVYISVADDGCGMDEATLRRAEEPFYRADRARSRAHGGAGLGLSLCRRIAEAHGTRLEIQSAVGRGTTVTIALTEVEYESEE